MLFTLLRRRSIKFVVAGTFLLIPILLGICDYTREKEIALMIGEPWEDMRQRSSARIDPAIPGETWFRVPKSDTRLRFIDPHYGFVTPVGRFFTVSFDANESIRSARMSPQIKPLLLEETLEVVMGLQAQWREKGWELVRLESNPPFADTPQWRSQLRDINKGGVTYWRAGERFQVMLIVNRFRDDSRPTEERYLITLSLSTPWGKP
nr:hypothetical protein [Pseudomonas sp. S25]